MLRTVHLHGPYKERYGLGAIELDVDTPRELFNGLMSQVPGFRSELGADKRLALVLTDSAGAEPQALAPEELAFTLGSASDIHLLPEVTGAGADPLSWAIFISEALSVSMATAITITTIAINVAASFVIGQVMQALAPSPDTSSGGAQADERPSFLYNGAVNVVEQGYPVPIVYGKFTVGSVVVSAGITVEDIPYTAAQATPPANGGGSTQPTTPATEPWQYAIG